VSGLAEIAERAPAKLNLGLRVVGVRPDSYHEIESLFAPIELEDDVAIALGGPAGVRISVAGDAADGVPADARNLAARAAEAFVQAARLGLGVTLSLTKRIPSPAGLGGGSSDAAAVLRGLARLAPGRISAAELRALALSLGADAPFFLNARPALVEGIGERVLPVAGVPALPVLLAHAGVGLSTRDVYAAYDSAAALTPRTAASNLRGLLALGEESGNPRVRWPDDSNDRLRALLLNDLEPAATRLCPLVAKLREELSQTGALAVGMSGSGPTMYAIFASEADAGRAQARIAGAGRKTWLTRTVPSRSE
jgi:4-diphosphocytidyl-2-C-methyl-D-erythritol kinase